jgi:hypothetical protein
MVSIARPRSHDVKTLPLQKLIVSAFPGGFNLPLWAASERGFLAARGIEVGPHAGNRIEQRP